MINVSDAWKDREQRFLLPESFVELNCAITDVGVQELATASGLYEAVFSDVSSITGNSGENTVKRYATLEPNLWALDGTRNILPTAGPYSNAGYVSNIGESGSVTISLPEVRTNPIPGVTIVWSSEYGEYPHVFTVAAKNGDTVVAEHTVIDNASNRSVVNVGISNYDSIDITIHNWCLPNHRPRVDSVELGLTLTFKKTDILSYKHEQSGSVVSGELPKNSIEFSIDNTDNRWDPSNPTGLEQYLSERQRITARYGLDIDGTTEWIKAGTFYLSEWRAPSNGMEASFVARDVFEYMMNEPYTGTKNGTLLDIANAAIAQADLPSWVTVYIDPSLNNYFAPFEGDYTVAEILQLCANAGCCVLYQDRNGDLRIEPRNTALQDYNISRGMAYSFPEIELSKSIKNITVSWGDEDGDTYTMAVGSSGETQTIDNPLIGGEAHAAMVARWVKSNLETRKTISGEYRCDPRLDLFDSVSVDSKFGVISPVVITDVVYDFSGAFKGTYTGRVMGEGV